MAKNPNDSNNNSNPNEIGSSLSDRIEEIGRSAYTIPAEERELRRKAKVARAGIDIFESLGQIARDYEPVQRIHKQNVNTLSRTQPRIRIGTEARIERISQQAVNEVGRSFDEGRVNRMVGELAGTSGMQQASLMYASTDYTALHARSAAIHQEISGIRSRASAAAETMFTKRGVNPQSRAALQSADREFQDKIRELAPINAAMRSQRQAGLHPESRMDALLKQRSGAASIVGGATDQVGSRLGSLSGGQLKELEIAQAKKLVDAFKGLEDAAKKGATNLDKLQKKAERTAENLEKTQNAIAAGGGGRGSLPYLAMAQSGFAAAGQAVQQIAVNQRLAQVQNVSGFANIENQKYQTYKAAAGGDVASQLALSQFGGAQQFGRELAAGARVGVGAQTASGIAQAAYGGVELANPIQDATTSGESGVNNTMAGTATSIVGGFDLARGVSAGQAQTAGIQNQMEAIRQLMAVSAEQLQGFRDFGVGAGVAAIGLGSAGAGFMNRAVSKDNLSRMTNSRISPEQFSTMAQFGAQNIGSVFNENQIFTARSLERAGYGTMQENMSRMSTLASAGSNNPQAGLQSVLENAFSKGIESSKALNMIAENTGAMVEKSAGRAMGLDTTAEAAAIVSAGINKNDPNQEYAVKRAARAADITSDIATNISTSYGGAAAITRTQRTTGLSGAEAIAAQSLDPTTLLKFSKLSEKEARAALLQKGIEIPNKSTAKGVIASLQEDQQQKILEAGGRGFAFFGKGGITEQQLLLDVRAGKISNKETAMLGRIAGAAGYDSADQFVTQIKSPFAAPNEKGKGKTELAINDPSKLASDQQKIVDDMRTQGFKQLSQAALEATAGFKTAAETLKALGNLSKSVEAIGDQGGEGKFKTAAADSAKTFGDGAIKFKTSVDKFTEAVGMMVKSSNISSGETADSYDDLKQKFGIAH